MLILLAFDLTRAHGIPSDIVRIGGTLDELTELAATGDHWGRPPIDYDVCEVWRLTPGLRPVRVLQDSGQGQLER